MDNARYNDALLRSKFMPVYTYRCENCGVQFERQQSFTDEPLKVCPECRKKTLRKVISPVRVVFKGSGFYATDHKSPSGSDPSRDTKREEAKPAKPKETKSVEKSDKSES